MLLMRRRRFLEIIYLRSLRGESGEDAGGEGAKAM
jgi:hypothetical protein